VAYFDIYSHPDTIPPYGLGHSGLWWYDVEKAEALKAAGVLN
jgi:microcin C transport system substrate-binding protein